MQNQRQNKKIHALAECAIMAGLAAVLSLLKFEAPWAYGGSVSLIMLPIIVASFRYGVLMGIATGVVAGILNWMTDGFYSVHWTMPFIDYIFAFGVVGIAGIFRRVNNKHIAIVAAPMLAGLLRLICHYFSGVIFFAEYAPEGQSVWIYSLVYNGGYMLPTIAITIAAVLALNYYKSSRAYLFGYDGK